MSQVAAENDAADRSGWWRGLEELASAPEVKAWLEKEYPGVAWRGRDGTDRRDFLRLMAASLALGGFTLTGCRRWPREEIRPHAAQPEGTAPGVPLHYATMFELDGVATGLLAKSYDGRPVKIEGNPLHPGSLGAADALMQASVLELYDPERSRAVLWRDPAGGPALQPSEKSWPEFDLFFGARCRKLRERQGAGLAVLAQPSGSPTWQRLREEFQVSLPKACWFEYQPFTHSSEYEGSRSAWGRVLRPQYRLDKASVIAAFDADPLGTHPARLRLARDWAAGRHNVDQGTCNRLYVVEPGFTITGSVADCRLAVAPSAVARCVGWLAARWGLIDGVPASITAREHQFLERLANDLEAARGAGVVLAGPAQSAEVHQLVHAINHRLGNPATTIGYSEEPLAAASGNSGSITGLSRLLEGNVVTTLVVVGGNPVFDGPADAPLRLGAGAGREFAAIHLSLHDNETSHECEWSVPAAHFLECWGDGRGWDGTHTLQQPLIQPLFGGRSQIGFLAGILGRGPDGRDLVRTTFNRLFPAAQDADWDKALHDGLVADSQFAQVDPGAPKVNRAVLLDETGGRELRLAIDHKVHDGRFANNAWLQELPDPLTKLAWDNAVMISPADAGALGLQQGQVVRLSAAGGESRVLVEAAVYILPGHADGCVTLPAGYGRKLGGHVGAGVGFGCGPLRTTANPWTVADVIVEKTGRHYPLAITQMHHIAPSIADVALDRRLGKKGEPGLLVHEALFSEFQHDSHAVHGHARMPCIRRRSLTRLWCPRHDTAGAWRST